jgi:endonuclease III
MLADEFGGRVPADSASLLRLPGVGNKTRNVIQAELFNIPSMAVDTHVERISKRLGFAKQKDNPDQIETKLRKLLKPRGLSQKQITRLSPLEERYAMPANQNATNATYTVFAIIFQK